MLGKKYENLKKCAWHRLQLRKNTLKAKLTLSVHMCTQTSNIIRYSQSLVQTAMTMHVVVAVAEFIDCEASTTYGQSWPKCFQVLFLL